MTETDGGEAYQSELPETLPTSDRKPESRTVDVNGRQVHYFDVGSGQPVLCLHGAGPGASAWTAYRPVIGALSKNNRLIVPDLAGFGESTSIADLSDPLRALAEPIRGLLAKLGLDRVHLMGHSLGGGVALRLALDNSHQVDRLVLVGSVGFEPSLMVPQPTEGGRLILRFLADPSEDRMRDLLRALVYDPSSLSDSLVRQRMASTVENLESTVALHTALADPIVRRTIDLSGQLQELTAKTLLIWGRDDRFVSLEAGLGMLSMIQHSRLYVIGRCGHSPQLEWPTDFNKFVSQFLRLRWPA